MNLCRLVIRVAVQIRNAICNLILALMSVLVQIAKDDPRNLVGGPEERDNERNSSFDRQDMARLIRLWREVAAETEIRDEKLKVCGMCQGILSHKVRYALHIRESFEEALIIILGQREEPADSIFCLFLEIADTILGVKWRVEEGWVNGDPLISIKMFFESECVFVAVSTWQSKDRARDQCAFQVILHWLALLIDSEYEALVDFGVRAIGDQVPPIFHWKAPK